MVGYDHYMEAPVFYTAGTGIPDEVAIEYFKDTNVLVVDRNFNEWFRGERKEK